MSAFRHCFNKMCRVNICIRDYNDEMSCGQGISHAVKVAGGSMAVTLIECLVNYWTESFLATAGLCRKIVVYHRILPLASLPLACTIMYSMPGDNWEFFDTSAPIRRQTVPAPLIALTEMERWISLLLEGLDSRFSELS